MMEKHFWELSGHWENYREMMFVTSCRTSACSAASR